MPIRRRFDKIKKLPCGRWQARYPCLDGRERKGPDTFTTKTEAGLSLSGIEADQARGTWRTLTEGQ